MKTIRIKCPAKINLTLEILNKREDGFHNLKSIMQAVDLYDILTFNVENAPQTQIYLKGNCDKIPYDERNLVYKAVVKFLEKTGIENQKIEIYIEKNIPVEAGLAGGSTDGAGTFTALNELYGKPLSDYQIEKLCASLGSDLNFCLYGGTALCTSRGEKIERLNTPELKVSLIKPKNFGISAKEAYTKFSQMKDKSVPDNTEKMISLLSKGMFDKTLLYNSLEKAVINDYEELKEIKNKVKGSMMSGSGPTFFVLDSSINADLDSERFLVIENLNAVNSGAEIF